MLKDILKESWAIKELAQEVAQETVQKAVQEAVQEAVQKAVQETREEERKKKQKEEVETLLFFIQMHFPALAQITKDRCESINDPQEVQGLLYKIIAAKSEKEVEQHLFT